MVESLEEVPEKSPAQQLHVAGIRTESIPTGVIFHIYNIYLVFQIKVQDMSGVLEFILRKGVSAYLCFASLSLAHYRLAPRLQYLLKSKTVQYILLWFWYDLDLQNRNSAAQCDLQ